MTADDLLTDRQRQMRDGHNPDDGVTGRARATRIAKLQAQIIEADELVAGLHRLRAVARRLDPPGPARRIDDELCRLGSEKVAERNALDTELRALQ